MARTMTTCYHCRTTFDTVTSRWCDCVSATRSIVCVVCGRCSCDAPREWSGTWGIRMPRRERGGCGAPSSTHKPVALVVEDQRIVRTMLCTVLSARFEVIVAETGSRALDLVKRYRPALVVTDALLPGLDGRELARAIKSDPETSHARVILVTGLYKSIKHANEAVLVYKVDAVLAKPVSARVLNEQIDRLLGATMSGNPASSEAVAHTG